MQIKRLLFPVIFCGILFSACGSSADSSVNVPAVMEKPTGISGELESIPEAVPKDPPPPETEEPTKPEIPFDYTICFTGDISVADDARTTNRWIANGRDTSAVFDSVIMQHMQDADICFADNEFPYTTRGTPTYGKDYTYRADPSNVSLMLDLGVDIVSIANNHTYDYGAEGVLDTLETLDNAGIARVGAGKDLEDASATCFMELDGLTVAFLSGTRVEWDEQTKGATETEPGVFRTVDPELLYQHVREAREEADLVIVYIHWGIEAQVGWWADPDDYLEDYQKTVGKQLIEEGADAVIGDHTHFLQGIEFYQGKPIVYSMGNFWFNGRSEYTALTELHVSGTRSDYALQLRYLPAMQEDCTVYHIADSEEQDTYYRYLESISPNAVFDADGNCTEVK